MVSGMAIGSEVSGKWSEGIDLVVEIEQEDAWPSFLL
jgi:hypothetical protein